jgi:hypothetical protein
MTAAGQHRIFHLAVWSARGLGWGLLLLAVLGISEFFSTIGVWEVLPSLALALVAVFWIVGLELFLHFCDRYLSRN